MEIVSIKLKNFRSHIDSNFTFEDGINLLLGNNGAGKSSVLEAIGFALFDAKTRTANKNIVRRGEKSGIVDISFIGNDGNSYRVERKFGTSSSWRLFVGDEQSHRYSNNDEVKLKLREVIGVSNSDINIFSDVICAVQNRFTDIFAQTDGDREKLFDKMFGVGVYRKIFEELNGKESIEKVYRKEADEIVGSLKTLEESSVDIGIVKENLLSEKKSLGRAKDDLLIIDKDIDKINSNIKSSSLIITDYEKNSELIVEKKRQLLSLNSSLEIADKNIASSTIAKSLVEKNLDNFNSFGKLRIKREALEKTIAHEVETRKKHKDLKEHIDSTTRQLSSNEKSIGEFQIKIKGDEEQKVNLNNEKQNLDKKLGSIKIELCKITDEGLSRNTVIDKYTDLLANFDTKKRESLDIKREIDLLTESGLDDSTLSERLSAVNEKILELEDKKSELSKIEKELGLRNSRLEELKSAQKELATGICPILKENCQNTEGSDSNYFRDRLNTLEDEILKLEEEEKLLNTVPKELENSQKERVSLEHSIKEVGSRVDKVSRLNENRDINDEHINLLIERLSVIESDILIDDDDYSKRVNNLQIERESSREIYKHIENERREIDSKIKSNSELLSKTDLNIKDRNSSIIKLENISKELIENRELLEQELLLINEDIKKIEVTREDIKSISIEMKTFENGHKIYLENSDHAGRLESFIESKDRTVSEVFTLKEDLTSIEKFISSINIDEIREGLKRLEDILKERNIDRDNFKDRISKLEKSIENINSEIEKYRKGQEVIKELKSRLKNLTRKLELTSLFRNSVKDMGRFVASTLVKNIAIIASEYFQKITGKSETLEWVVDDLNKYTVFLTYRKDGEILRKSFIELSGGEQVAVALSIRTALAKKLAGGNFIIFDEPTINLDSERKVSLAESIKSMLGTLDQTIIVTHDDVFREMAQKVIEI